ncbi:MAG: efflux RND transporter periplasmic adaptor subunit [Bryobacterales bacterium]|nr:efflux RND transporter periplasmic adaptor subunit [Bryobacterales bacterium]
MRGKWLLFGGIAFFLAVGAGAFYWWMKQLAPPAAVQVKAPILPPGTEVRLDGTIQAVNMLQVTAPIDGIAEEFAVKPGDEVFEGQVLGRIANESLLDNERESALETDRAQTKLNTAESELIAARLEDSRASADAARIRSELQRAERAYQRQAQLVKEGAIPRNAYQKVEQDYLSVKSEAETLVSLAEAARQRIQRSGTDVEMARKALAEKEQAHDAAKAELASASVVSPIDGLVIAMHKNAGDAVTKSSGSLIDIASDLSQLELVIEANPAIAARVAAGEPALVQTPELPGDGLKATVKSVENGKVVIEFSSPSPLIRPGMTAVARLKLK